MIKKAYAIQMTYDVSDTEKVQAERALMYFNQAEKVLNQCSNHLNIMKTPFKDHPEMQSEDVINIRAALRRYRDKAVENFNDFKSVAFKCVSIMKNFGSDTQTVKLMKSFISSIDALEVKVNAFVELFTDLESKDFSNAVVSSIEDIQKPCDELEEIIDERITDHIQSNILAKNWVDSVSNELQMKVEEKTPLILDLFNKRQDQLNEAIKEKQ
jgi:hypothetical protein